MLVSLLLAILAWVLVTRSNYEQQQIDSCSHCE